MKVLGIDLGTTNSAVALVNRHGVPEIIPNREGEYVTPSVVFFDGTEAIVGRVAKRSAALDPDNIVQCVKREMGNKAWRFHPASGGEFSPEAISSLILRRIKEDAEMIRGETFTEAVISVPAYFADPERQATHDAAEMAGLTPVRIINEPTAAALAYGLGSTAGEEFVVVYDLGGGTFDVSILKITPKQLTVLATGGDRKLGGVDWDNAIVDWLRGQLAESGGQRLLDGPSADPRFEQDLREKAETAKHALSQMRQTKIVISAGRSHQTITLSREVFQELTSDLLDRTQDRLEHVVEEAGLRWPEISKLLLVGGSTKMPAVADMLQRVTGIVPSHEVHPDEAVALGAAVQAALVARDRKTPRAGTGSRTIPESGRAHEETGIKEVAITDVTAHSLGVVLLNKSTNKQYNQIVVDRGAKLPTHATCNLETVNDDQVVWKAQLTQGEEEDLRYVKVIGTGEIRFDSPKPAAYPLLMKLEYDIDGLIQAHVYDGNTEVLFGELRINRVSNLTRAELAAMKQRASEVALG
jgi:molecular chaperone DnaK